MHGKFVEAFDPPAVALISSQGYESPKSKLFLRLTVLLSDMVVYLPASLFCAISLYNTPAERVKALVGLVLNPALIIIDHGHFQYNGISLGLVAAATGAICQDAYIFSAILFSLALNHKQMTLYLAPAIFAHLFGRCLCQSSWPKRLVLFVSLGLAVLTTFAIVWAPFLTSIDDAMTVFSRVFPTRRGLFEDYVANFWCVSSLVIKWKKLFSHPTLLMLCASGTLMSFLPSFLMQIHKPSKRTLPFCMASSALSFFLFSYQVHEKSILLPLLPICMLLNDGDFNISSVFNAAMISMFPLLERDGLVIAYFALNIFHNAIFSSMNRSTVGNTHFDDRRKNQLENVLLCLIRMPSSVSILLTMAIHVFVRVVPFPARYPFLSDAIMVSWAFLHFCQLLLYINLFHWRWYSSGDHAKLKSA